MTGKGNLVLFDLSGYTEFLARSEVGEAAGILESLVGTLLQHIRAAARGR